MYRSPCQFRSGKSLFFLLASVSVSLPCRVGLQTENKSELRIWNLVLSSNSLDRIEHYEKRGSLLWQLRKTIRVGFFFNIVQRN